MENIRETLSDDDFVPNTPVFRKNTTSVLQKKSRSNGKNPGGNKVTRAKRKVICSPAKTEAKQNQLSITNFVTRMKRIKSLNNECTNPISENTLISTFEKYSDCKSTICDSPTKCMNVENINQCNDIIKNLDALKFSASKSDDISSCNREGEKSNGFVPVSLEGDTTLQKNKVQESELNFSWIEDIEWDNMDNDMDTNSSAFKPLKESSVCNTKYRVCSVVQYHSKQEIELVLEDLSKKANRKCILKGFWINTAVSKGDEVRVLAPFANDVATINDDAGFIIVNPDFLVSSTSIVSTLFCMRKAALSHKFRYWDSSNKIMMIGSFVHQLFQEAVNAHYNTKVELPDIINNILKKTENIVSMYCQGISECKVQEEFMPFIWSISEWIKQYCSTNSDSDDLKVTAVRDIEDNIWCPRYGIKGKVDLTLVVQMENVEKVMPLELKTGAASFSAEHQGQVNLYSLMMEDRSREKLDGLLLYLRNKAEMRCIPSEHKTHRGLIQLRNEFVHYIQGAGERDAGYVTKCNLPDPLNSKRLCQKCSYLLPCSVYQKIDSETKINPTHAMSVLVPEATQHLSKSHFDFFQHWMYLLNLDSTTPDSKGFWNESAEIREKKGLCFSNMVLKEDSPSQQRRDDVYIHKFFRSENCSMATSLASIGIKKGEYVAISNQDNTFEVALAMGFVIHVESSYVEISVERDIQKLQRYGNYIFRIDKQNAANSGGSIGHNNLMKLMLSTQETSKLRQLVIEKKEPEFQQTLSKKVAVLARPFVKCLNKLQRKAIFKALMANDYMLLRGMPGTGKTSTIVALVRLLLVLDQTILLTSHTHSAVDNILLKLQECKTDFLRIGQLSKIDEKLHPHAFEFIAQNITSVADLENLMKSKKIIATTCLGVNNVILQKLKFDICIVDESSQITLPDCLGPLFLSKKFVLVGDPKQLPPVVVNQEAKSKGLEKSLFECLETSSNCMELVMQYRMNKEIMRLCNALAYNDAMICGDSNVEKATLNINYPEERFSSWLRLVLDKELENSALFLNTDDIPALEKQDDIGQIINDAENQLIFLLVQHLLQAGLTTSEIGVITPYRHQVDLIAKTLMVNYRGIEVNTVDQYQGRDKEVILISCVRSKNGSANKKHTMPTIMDDMRRLTVAISRAKKKLVVIGSQSTLQNYKCFSSLFKILHKGQVVNLPKNSI